MGLEAIYRRPNTSKPTPEHKVYILAEGSDDQSSKPGLDGRYHLHTHGPGLSIFGGHHGLAQPVCADLVAVQYPGGGLLC